MSGIQLPPNSSLAFDPVDALAAVADDRDLLKQMVELFCADSPRMLMAVGKSVKEGDAKALARAAHALKGSVAIFGKSESLRAVECLELSGIAETMDDADAQFLSLELLVAALEKDLVGFCR